MDYLAYADAYMPTGLEDGIVSDIKALLREAADTLRMYHRDSLATKLEAAAEQFTAADKVAEKYSSAMAGLAAELDWRDWRISTLESQLTAAEARPAHSVAVEIGHLQCARNNLQEALEHTDVALSWINTMLDTTKEQSHE